MEKKIMKPAEICITRRLPTRVDPRRPTFSLLEYTNVRERERETFDSMSNTIKSISNQNSTHIETVDPVKEPHSPSIRIPNPCFFYN